MAVDATTHEIVVSGASENSVSDCEMFPHLIKEVPGEVKQVSADGSYDRKKVYTALNENKIKRAAIPPRKGAKIWQHGNSKKERLIRDENLRAVRKHGRPKWKREADYHQRSKAETAMRRYKTIFTDQLKSRKQENQFQEMHIKCAAMNRMTHLGMPESYRVSV